MFTLSNRSTKEVTEKDKVKTLAEFLENTPPNQHIRISNLATLLKGDYGYHTIFNTPEIRLHCDDNHCKGIRFFRPKSSKSVDLRGGTVEHLFLEYVCSNCKNQEKIFSLAVNLDKPVPGETFPRGEGDCFKFGESPAYGPPVSPKLISLIGPDRDEFLKGRRCENQGLGVGSFSYYRRVVENQKNRILEEIIRISEKIDAPADKIEVLKSAVRQTQFSKALEMAKYALPESLFIDGHSPLQLLHSALSEGLHTLTDDQCLEIAHSVRVILTELSDKLAQAMKDDAELAKAMSVLMKRAQ